MVLEFVRETNNDLYLYKCYESQAKQVKSGEFNILSAVEPRKRFPVMQATTFGHFPTAPDPILVPGEGYPPRHVWEKYFRKIENFDSCTKSSGVEYKKCELPEGNLNMIQRLMDLADVLYPRGDKFFTWGKERLPNP